MADDEAGPERTGEGTTLPPPDAPDRDAAERFDANRQAAEPDDPPQDGDEHAHGHDRFGEPGRPLRRNGPYYWGFLGGLGALTAWYLLQVLGQMSQVLTLIGVSAFLAMGLDPLVRFLQRRGLNRGPSVGLTFLGLVLVVAAFASAVLPAVITQIGQLTEALPDTVTSLQNSELFKRLDEEYGVVSQAGEQLRERLTSGETVTQLFGGLLGAGRAVLGGVTSTVTVLVLTLYFLASLPAILDSVYRLVPATRRPRVRLLGDEIVRRIGGYVAGQTAIAFLNALLTFVIVLALGLPYPAVLAIVVGLLGLIPLIGATLGALVVVLVGLADSWQIAVGLAIYYLVYQQVENYLIAPRVMSRTVAVPGALALVAALAGGSLLGVLGALISIPVAAGILLIVQEVVLPRMEET